MSFYPITVNTEPEAEAHIFAEDDAAIYQSVFGGDCVFDIGGKLKLTILSNNKVRIGDGVLCVGGHIGRNKYGEYEDLDIDNGVSGKNRNDLIVARFATTGTGGIDTFTLSVKKGTAGTTAVDPSIEEGNLYEGERFREFPLYRVKIEGLSIAETEKLFSIRKTNEQLQSDIDKINIALKNLTPRDIGAIAASNLINSLSDVIENTVSGKAAGALAVKELNTKKQNNLTLGNNTIPNLDSWFVGCTWYNAEKNNTGVKPFEHYGFIIAFQSGQSNYFQIAIPYGGDTNEPKWRTYVNGKWQEWRSFYDKNALAFKGDVPVSSATITNLNSVTGPGIYKIDGKTIEMSCSNGGAYFAGTYQLKGTFVVLPYFNTQILIVNDFKNKTTEPRLAIRFYMGSWTNWNVIS